MQHIMCQLSFTTVTSHVNFQGRSSSINEPWPDICGVFIVFVISFMFVSFINLTLSYCCFWESMELTLFNMHFQIMGLENSKIFTILMLTGVLSISALIAVITYVRGSSTEAHEGSSVTHGMSDVRLINFH